MLNKSNQMSNIIIIWTKNYIIYTYIKKKLHIYDELVNNMKYIRKKEIKWKKTNYSWWCINLL